MLSAAGRLGTKHLYKEHENLGSIEFVFYRAFLGFAFNIIWLNRNLKKEMYTSVKRELVPGLIIKCIHGNLMGLLLYSVIMWWPLSTVAAASLATPFMVMILACLFLKEYATFEQIGFLIITLVGATVMVFYTPDNEEESARKDALGSASFLAYISLFLFAFCVAGGSVITRRLRKLSN